MELTMECNIQGSATDGGRVFLCSPAIVVNFIVVCTKRCSMHHREWNTDQLINDKVLCQPLLYNYLSNNFFIQNNKMILLVSCCNTVVKCVPFLFLYSYSDDIWHIYPSHIFEYQNLDR